MKALRGLLSEVESVRGKMKATSAYGVREQELLDALMLTMMPPPESKTDSGSHGSDFIARNNLVLGLCSTIPLSNPTNRAIWKKDQQRRSIGRIQRQLYIVPSNG